MKQVLKYFSNLSDAQQFQKILANKYNYTKLVLYPANTERGVYVWSVK